VRLPGVRIRRLRLNRHLPEVDQLARHAHAFSQILCYLSGRGRMSVAGREQETGPGSVIFLPPHCEHSFRETTGRRPLCLVLDLDWRGAVKRGPSLGRLTQAESTEIRRELAEITRLSDPTHPSSRLLVAGVVLRILDTLLRGLDLLPARTGDLPAFVHQFDRELRKAEEPLPAITAIAARMGYQTDYLNRIFKKATGQTLREYRDARVIKKARRLLRENRRVKDVCAALGFLDQNYFSRWFRKYTGVQPREWAASVSAERASPPDKTSYTKTSSP
jgi:Response regulator containing CheY-like receiver domain and AraC-type DNA-binding domain